MKRVVPEDRRNWYGERDTTHHWTQIETRAQDPFRSQIAEHPAKQEDRHEGGNELLDLAETAWPSRNKAHGVFGDAKEHATFKV